MVGQLFPNCEISPTNYSSAVKSASSVVIKSGCYTSMTWNVYTLSECKVADRYAADVRDGVLTLREIPQHTC